MCLVRWASALSILVAGCSDSGTDRPRCNAGAICIDGGAGDGDADVDADSDSDADGDYCNDLDGDGHVDDRCPNPPGDDCDDSLQGGADIHPDEAEVCDGMDNDCEGGVDEGLLVAGVDLELATVSYDNTIHIAFVPHGSGFGLLRLEGETPGKPTAPLALSFTELDASGAVVGTPVEISSTPNNTYYDTIALASQLEPEGFVAAWGEAPDGAQNGRFAFIQAASIRGSDVAVVDVGSASELGDFSPVLAVGGGLVLVVWNWFETDMRFALLDPDDLSVSSEGTLSAAPSIGGRPSVAWTGERFLIATEVGGRNARVLSMAPDGTTTTTDMGMNTWDSPVLAWDGEEAAYMQLDGTDQEVHRFDARGPLQLAPTIVEAGGHWQRLAGIERSFALIATVSSDPTHLYGTLTFWNLSPNGQIANHLLPDDSAASTSADPWVVPADDGWALAWIDAGNKVRIDFVRCP